MSNAIAGLRLIVFPNVTLFQEFQGCGEFLLTVLSFCTNDQGPGAKAQ
jgi:hypothetical protein